MLEQQPGVGRVMDGDQLDEWYASRGHGRTKARRAHNEQRSGTLTCVAADGYWFAYYYWEDDKMAPDFARCVAIHKKPGYDPAEMLWRYAAPFGLLWFLFKIILSVLLGIKTLVDASPLDCRSIRGSHGGLPESDAYRPVVITKHVAATGFARRGGAKVCRNASLHVVAVGCVDVAAAAHLSRAPTLQSSCHAAAHPSHSPMLHSPLPPAVCNAAAY